MTYEKAWRTTAEGWVLEGRILDDSGKVVARASFELPCDKKDLVEALLGIDAKEYAETHLEEYLRNMASRLPS